MSNQTLSQTITTDNTTGSYYRYADSTIYDPNSNTIIYIDNQTPSYSLEVDGSVKLGGKNTNKIDWDLSRFTLIKRLKFLFNLIFKGSAIMEVEPKQIKLEKALEVLRNAK